MPPCVTSSTPNCPARSSAGCPSSCEPGHLVRDRNLAYRTATVCLRTRKKMHVVLALENDISKRVREDDFSLTHAAERFRCLDHIPCCSQPPGIGACQSTSTPGTLGAPAARWQALRCHCGTVDATQRT